MSTQILILMIAGVAITRFFSSIKNRNEKVKVVDEVNKFFTQSMLAVVFYLFLSLFVNVFIG
jgi:hypothetical protein